VVASASYDKTVRLWDAVTGAALRTLEGHSGSVSSVAFSPDGKVVTSASDDYTVRLWDAVTGAALRTLEGHSWRVNSVAISPDGKVVASASHEETVRLWDAVTGAALQTLELDITTGSLSFSTSGQYLITDRGVLDVSFLQLSPDPLEQLRTLFVSNDWVAEKEADILWLPPDYRATCVAVRDGMVVLGHSSGNISFLKFEEESKTV
jgi:WD40 repeat protein